MTHDPENGTDRAALIRNSLMLGAVVLGMGGYLLWQRSQPKVETVPEEGALPGDRASPGTSASPGAGASPGKAAAPGVARAVPPPLPAVSESRGSAPRGKFAIGETAVTADEARHHVRKWAEAVYQAEGLTPEPPNLPKERWQPFARAIVWAECGAPQQLSHREVHDMARALAPVAGEHPVSAFVTGMVLLGEPGSVGLLEKAVQGLGAQPGGETLAFHAAAGLALATSDDDDGALAKKRVDAAIAALRRALDAEAGYAKQHDRVTAHVLKGGHMGTFFEALHERVAAEVAKTEAAKPWVKKWIEGEHCLQKAWDARGGGYLNTVSDDGMAVFRHESEKARRLLQEAWEMKPDTPEPAVTLIYSSLSMKKEDAVEHMRRWFGEVLNVQVDVPEAAQHYLWGLRRRWYGSHAMMQELGLVCARTKRYDSGLPWVLLQAHRDCASEWDVPDEYFKEIRSHAATDMQDLVYGAENEPERAPWRSVDRTHAAIYFFKCGRHEEAQKWLEKLDFKPNKAVIEDWGDVDPDLLVGRTAAFTIGESAEKLRAAERAEDSFQGAQAHEIYSEVIETGGDKLSEAGRRYLESKTAVMGIEKRLGGGGAALLLPDAAFRAWTREGGGWMVDHGVLTHSGGGELVYSTCEARIGPSFTADGEIEVIDPGDACQVWLSYGYPEHTGKERWIAVRFAYDDGRTLALLSNGMGRPLEHPEIHVEPRFRFKLVADTGGISLFVDGAPAFENVPVPDDFVKERYGLIGLGAATQSDKTQVKVHSLTVRR